MSRRRSLYVAGFGHKNPIPAACVMDDLVMSGIVTGLDPETGRMADGIEAQCGNMFRHVRAIMEAAGGSTDDILKMTVWLKDRGQREPVNREWLAMFPDPQDRPARQAMQADLQNGILVQCDFVAKLAPRS